MSFGLSSPSRTTSDRLPQSLQCPCTVKEGYNVTSPASLPLPCTLLRQGRDQASRILAQPRRSEPEEKPAGRWLCSPATDPGCVPACLQRVRGTLRGSPGPCSGLSDGPARSSSATITGACIISKVTQTTR